MKDLILIGGGGHCKSCIDVIEAAGEFKIVAIVDVQEKVGTNILNYKISHTDDDLEQLIKKHTNVLICLGQIKSPELRIRYFDLCSRKGAKFPVIVSPRSYISRYATIGEGTIVMHDALINASAVIGKNCIINTKSLIEHDAQIGNNCHISTAAVVNGGVSIGDNCFIGSNATIAQQVTIAENSIVSAGSFIK